MYMAYIGLFNPEILKPGFDLYHIGIYYLLLNEVVICS